MSQSPLLHVNKCKMIIRARMQLPSTGLRHEISRDVNRDENQTSVQASQDGTGACPLCNMHAITRHETRRYMQNMHQENRSVRFDWWHRRTVSVFRSAER
jgi:hypothetical protein